MEINIILKYLFLDENSAKAMQSANAQSANAFINSIKTKQNYKLQEAYYYTLSIFLLYLFVYFVFMNGDVNAWTLKIPEILLFKNLGFFNSCSFSLSDFWIRKEFRVDEVEFEMVCDLDKNNIIIYIYILNDLRKCEINFFLKNQFLI